MESDHHLKDQFEREGRVWFRNAICENDLSLLDEAALGQQKPGQRLTGSALIGEALSPANSLLKAIRRLDPAADPVRIVSFNKSENANWGVPWHQDRVIAVARRANVTGYRNWTRKSGAWHCEPPEEILDRMLLVRVHLDDTDSSNGAMSIALGSHAKGIIPSTQAEGEAENYPIEACTAKRGDILVLKMLTLHASKPAQIRSVRRVLRIDFASYPLPAPLSWVKLDGESKLSH